MATLRTPKVIRTLTITDFIEKELIKNIGEIKVKYPFIAFSLIFLGIELIGKCLCPEESFLKGKGRDAFNLCIKTHMKKYEKFIGTEHDMYTNIRNGFAHSFRQKGKFAFTEKGSQDKNLARLNNGEIVLHIDDFYKDFIIACNLIINDIKNGILHNPKFNQPFLKITD